MGTIIPVEDTNKLGEVIKNYDTIIANMNNKIMSNNKVFCDDLENIVKDLFYH